MSTIHIYISLHKLHHKVQFHPVFGVTGHVITDVVAKFDEAGAEGGGRGGG